MRRQMLAAAVGLVLATALFAQTRQPGTQQAATTPAKPSQLPDKLFRQLASDSDDVRRCISHTSFNETASHLSARTIDLNSHGRRDYLVSVESNPESCTLCGNRRCSQWVYVAEGKGYRQVAEVLAADDIVVLKNKTHGFFDLEVNYPAGNTYPGSTVILQYDGSVYRKVPASNP